MIPLKFTNTVISLQIDFSLRYEKGLFLLAPTLYFFFRFICFITSNDIILTPWVTIVIDSEDRF